MAFSFVKWWVQVPAGSLIVIRTIYVNIAGILPSEAFIIHCWCQKIQQYAEGLHHQVPWGICTFSGGDISIDDSDCICRLYLLFLVLLFLIMKVSEILIIDWMRHYFCPPQLHLTNYILVGIPNKLLWCWLVVVKSQLVQKISKQETEHLSFHLHVFKVQIILDIVSVNI